MSAKFEIEKGSDGHFHFHLKAANGEIIFSSQRYKAKASAQCGVDSVKTNARVDAHYERKTSNNNEPYFILKAANGETVGCSQMYSSPVAMEKGLESVKANAPTAAVVDLT
jgi:uncharacterized protein YegP (UPF0339 family)